MVSTEALKTGVLETAEEALEKINNPVEIPEESFEDATMERAIIRAYSIQLIPHTPDLVEKCMLIGLGTLGVGVTGLFLTPLWKLCEQYPILILPASGAVAIYLAGGVDYRRTGKNGNISEKSKDNLPQV